MSKPIECNVSNTYQCKCGWLLTVSNQTAVKIGKAVCDNCGEVLNVEPVKIIGLHKSAQDKVASMVSRKVAPKVARKGEFVPFDDKR